MGPIVITGSASGIGAATRRLLEGQGRSIVGVDLHDAEVSADLSTVDGRAHAVAEIARRAPDGLDGCVAGAGLGPHERPVERIMAVNFFGAVAVLDGLLPLLARGGGTAVAICSNSAGITPVDDPALLELTAAGDERRALASAGASHGATVYGNSKLALGRAVRARAREWGDHGVRLNAIAPGPVMTPLLQGSIDDPELGPLVTALPVPLGGAPVPPEAPAGIIAFLLSAASWPIHGSIVFADGGTDALLRSDHV